MYLPLRRQQQVLLQLQQQPQHLYLDFLKHQQHQRFLHHCRITNNQQQDKQLQSFHLVRLQQLLNLQQQLQSVQEAMLALLLQSLRPPFLNRG